MSRVANNPIALPSGVEVKLDGQHINVKGSRGAMEFNIHPDVALAQDEGQLKVSTRNGGQAAKALAGTTRAVVSNMVTGVSQGFERRLIIQGVGYRAQAQGDKLNLSLGFSHPIVYQLPAGVKAETPSQTEIVIKGSDKQRVGQVAAEVRGYKPPEPYKGKGVRYADEAVVLKETKKK